MDKKIIWLIVVGLLLTISIYINIKQQLHIREKDNQIYVTDSLRKIDSTKYCNIAIEYQNSKQANNDLKRQNEGLLEEIQKGKEQITTLTNLVLKIKNQQFTHYDTVTVFKVKDSIIQVPIGDDIVKFDEKNDIMRVYGETSLYPKKGYKMNFEGIPFSVDLVLTEDENGVFKSYLDTKTKDLEAVKINTRVLRYNDVSFWKDFSSIVGLNLTTKNTFIDFGLLYKKVGLKVIGGYDYQNYTIEKGNLYYGAGFVYKLF